MIKKHIIFFFSSKLCAALFLIAFAMSIFLLAQDFENLIFHSFLYLPAIAVLIFCFTFCLFRNAKPAFASFFIICVCFLFILPLPLAFLFNRTPDMEPTYERIREIAPEILETHTSGEFVLLPEEYRDLTVDGYVEVCDEGVNFLYEIDYEYFNNYVYMPKSLDDPDTMSLFTYLSENIYRRSEYAEYY